MTAFKLSETKMSLLYAPEEYALALDVSADCNSVKGTLAWQFAVIFGHFDEFTRMPINVGNVAVMMHNSRFIYFLVTKDSIYESNTYAVLETALICMREYMRVHEVKKVAIPRICCSNDGLSWPRVRIMILKIFAREYNVEIMVCDHDGTVQIPPKCRIDEVKGNIFSSPEHYSLVHSVSADFAMNCGIGLQFKCKFGQVNELLKQNKHTGNVAVLKDQDRFVYYLITKERNHERCTYPALYYALMSMREHMVHNNITKLAIPRIGCGIDRLSWLRVKNILEFVFANDSVEIVVYFYDLPEVVPRRSKSRTLESLVSRLSLSRED